MGMMREGCVLKSQVGISDASNALSVGGLANAAGSPRTPHIFVNSLEAYGRQILLFFSGLFSGIFQFKSYF